MSRQQRRSAKSVVSQLSFSPYNCVDEQQIQAMLENIEEYAADIRERLEFSGTLPPEPSHPLEALDRHVRIEPGDELHNAVVKLLQCLPESEWFIDSAGNRMFRHDHGLWAALCDVSRMQVMSHRDYIEKRIGVTDLREKFQAWIAERYLARPDEDQTSFLSRLRKWFTERPPKSRSAKRPQGRPTRSDNPAEGSLERRFWAVYEKHGLAEACRECGIDEARGILLRNRLRTRNYRERAKNARKRSDT